MKAADSIEAARAGNVKMSSLMNSKQLTLNQDKTGFILFGKEARTRQARKEIALSPIFCTGFISKAKVADKWLFHQGGLAESVLARISDREPNLKAVCYEAAAFVEITVCGGIPECYGPV